MKLIQFYRSFKYKQGRFIDISKYSTGLLGQQCPESLTSLRADVDKWCSNPLPFLYCSLKAHKAIVESEEFFNLLSKVENYEYINGNLRIMGLKVIGTDIKLDEYSEVIPDENTEFHNLGYPIYEEWWNY